MTQSVKCIYCVSLRLVDEEGTTKGSHIYTTLSCLAKTLAFWHSIYILYILL